MITFMFYLLPLDIYMYGVFLNIGLGLINEVGLRFEFKLGGL